jgi:isopenicillin-N N-acyltransferase like protein
MKKKIFYFILTIILILIITFKISTHLTIPKIQDKSILNKERIKVSDNFYKFENSWLKKTNSNLWELYIEGDSFERGVAIGKLLYDLNDRQEEIFIKTIRDIIPSNIALFFIGQFVLWYNRDIDKYINDEYKNEIYGIAVANKIDHYSYICSKYQRLINYHAAHDIGHLLQDKNIVGCTSFAVWGNKTNKKFLHARNFDFYGGEHFSDNKIVFFVNPKNGYKFMSLSWASLIGVVSGMNEKGLAVTVNAIKGTMPKSTGTPVSLVIREVLQYAKNIDEAVNIIKKKNVFVSDLILISSNEDNKSIIVCKMPDKMFIIDNKSNYMLSTNSLNDNLDKYKKNEFIDCSEYRYLRLKELVNSYKKIDIGTCSKILRDMKGVGGKTIGFGNEKAINQLIAHHSIMFDIKNKIVWISEGPFQLGRYIAYDLNKIFTQYKSLNENIPINSSNLTIPKDKFLDSKDFIKFNKFKELKKKIVENIKRNEIIDENILKDFINCNPEYYEVYSIAGNYYYKHKDYNKALLYYQLAITKEIPNRKDFDKFNNLIKSIKMKHKLQ